MRRAAREVADRFLRALDQSPTFDERLQPPTRHFVRGARRRGHRRGISGAQVKSATLVTTLTTLTTAMAVAAPLVVFGFLYVLHVHPARAAAVEARSRLEIAREELSRQRVFVSGPTVVEQVSALDEFAARTGQADGVEEAVDALTAVLDSPAVGGVSNVSIQTGAPEDVPTDATVRLFSQTMKQTPVTLTFDARFEQIGRFFWNLRVLPTAFHLQSVELTPAAGIACAA